ncbi:hypothetical protein N7478_003292 [Penicillium angulare]|uniref:uncharacterized protein n=1 Tax=Penicillium angulare TaxID=116970 RepID=UPI00254147F5|nr:uncharacterized protein N7478_003292 [Penicillium angulare]KAJ5287606.1 hypothetical protein N7478_003292 [Penicillium angulare]
MPLNSMRTRKPTKKDGRKRTSSTVSTATTTSTQAGSVESVKTPEKVQTSGRTIGSKNVVKPQAASESSPQSAEPTKKVPNVFEFLEDSDVSPSSSSESESESEDEAPVPATRTAVTKIQSPKPRASPVPHALLVSKAGTSPKLSGSSTGGTSRIASDSRPPQAPSPPSVPSETQLVSRKPLSPPARKSSAPKDYPSSTAGSPPPPGKRQLQISRPENYYRDAASIHRSPLPPSPPSSPEDSIHRALQRRDSTASQATSGYGLVASHLTRSRGEDKGAFPPMYRRFESLNHRVLLHLQDEIAQMEEDLNILDEYEEMHRAAAAEKDGNKPVPASRRVDAQSQSFSSLHYRRMDLMSALIQKTEQYNNALSAYSKVIQTLPRATEDDIQNYRSWMKEHNPIAAAETRFLDDGVDLVSLTPRLAASAAAAPVYMAIIIASAALLLPLLAFSMIAEFSGRLVVVTVVAGATAAIAANYSAGIDALVDSRDGWRCATLYFGFMTFAAMFIP